MEERRDKRAAHVRAVEAAESETAEERRESGRSPSWVASRAEEILMREDLRRAGGSFGGGIAGTWCGASGASIVGIIGGCISGKMVLFPVVILSVSLFVVMMVVV